MLRANRWGNALVAATSLALVFYIRFRRLSDAAAVLQLVAGSPVLCITTAACVRIGDLGVRLQMLDEQRDLTRTATTLHREMRATADAIGILLADGFHYLALFAIGATTVWSALAAFFGMLNEGRAGLSDILLLFIYLEIGAMVGIYFKTTRLPVRYLIYIAMTALGRVLIEVGGAEHKTGKDLLIVAGAIFVLSLAVLVLRFASNKDDPSDTSSHGRHLKQDVD
jgi:protein PsiE